MKVYKIDANSDASRDVSTDTGWLDTSWLTDDSSFYIVGTWAGFNVVVDVSNEPYYNNVARSKFSTVATYTVASPPRGIPRNLGARIRFRRSDTGAISGAAYVCVAPGKDRNGNLLPISPEPTGGA